MMSASASFVHLRLHSEYSISDGTVRLDEVVRAARDDAMPALGLADLGNVFGLVKFYQAARSAGVKPVVGCDAWIANPVNPDQPQRLLLLCRSRSGYLALCRLLTRAYRENLHRGRAELRREWFNPADAAGLLAISGAAGGDVGQALAAGNTKLARQLASAWATLFPDAYYIEIQRAGQPDEALLNDESLALAEDLGIPVVATHPVQFLRREDFKAHEARVCIAQGRVLDDRRRPRDFTAEQYFKSAAEMQALFADVPEALARRCNLQLDLGKPRLPEYPTPAGVTLDDYLLARSREGLEARLAALFPDAAERDAKRPEYLARLDFETRTIIQMGFPGYFLIVADFINWAKTNQIPVGPGRGSGAGSLVAYSLGITDLDPLRYQLLFERFLNPERISMPDFDIDFCQHGRDRVIDYVKHKYGAHAVSQIVTFGTMAAKAVVRDAGRVLGLPYGFCDGIAKLIPFTPGKLVTLRRRTDRDDDKTIYAREVEPALKERERNEEEVRELLALGESLEGLTRNVGMHAGGVLIAPGSLTDFCPLYVAEGSEAMVSQFDKDDVEAVGLVKFDFLGLTTLTILDWTVRDIRKRGDAQSVPPPHDGGGPASPKQPGAGFSLEAIPLDDPAAFRVFAGGNTTAVFQFESRGMRDLLIRAKPDRLEDLIAMNALYRPGPMDLIPTWINRKHGREPVEYLDPRLETILGPTYGVMVYQEQVMQIAQVIAGYSLGSADLLRRAMGKKKLEEMAQQRQIFVSGAIARKLPADRANQLFDLMEKFAGYGFNKSHSAAYALLAYQTAYLKAHFPAEFIAANLSAVMDDTDKVQILIDDARLNHLEILPPDINSGIHRFEPVDGRRIRYGLGAVKGTGESAIGNIGRVVNRRSIESLIRAGAFDALGAHRAGLCASVSLALEAAEKAALAACQESLFGAAGQEGDKPPLVDVRRWDTAERLQNEKLALGLYLSGHPFDSHADEVQALVRRRLADLTPSREPVLVAGIVRAVRRQNPRRGYMAFVTLDDATAQIEVTIFAEHFDQHRAMIREDALLFVRGRVETDRREEFAGELRVRADELFDLEGARTRHARALQLQMNGQAEARRLGEILAPFAGGGCAVRVLYENRDASCELDLGERYRVRPADTLLRALGEWLSTANVHVLY